MPVCPRRKDRAPVAPKKGPRSRAAPYITRTFCCGLLSFQTCHLSVTDDVVVPATVLLFSAVLIACFVVLATCLFRASPWRGGLS